VSPSRPLSELARRARAAAGGKFGRDALWNLGAVAMLAVCGLAINLLIGRYLGAAPFGVYNQVWAAYIFFSQAAIGGIDRSVLRAVAERPADRAHVSAVILGALVPAVSLAAGVGLAFWASRGVVAALLESDGVARGIEAATPGLFFFALNKVGLAVVNAVQRMRAFALYSSLRYVAMVGGLMVVVLGGFDSSRVAFLFTFAEGVLFVPLAIEVARLVRPSLAGKWRDWSREHLRYGIKSAASGMLLELNSRLDVLMLGLFLADGPVGVYSFAAFVAEGVFQVLVVLQNNYNPILAEHIAGGRLRELEAIVQKGRRVTYALFAGIAVAACAGFPVLLAILEKPEFREGWLPFAFLLAGMFVASGYMPFAQTLLMANRPGRHTLMMASIVLVNAYGNSVLIPIYGLEGAALATAMCLACSAVALRGMSERLVGLRL
jgi:O-antigen/teichoic acid export membrane protein